MRRLQLDYQNARQYRVKPAMFYAGATNYVLQRSAGGRDSLGNLGYSSQVQCSLVHSPRSAFRCLPYVACSMASDEKLGVGLGTRLPRT